MWSKCPGRLRFAGLAAALMVAAPAAAQDVNGQWLTEGGKARVNIASCGGTKLCGNIVWLREPNDASGQPKRDVRNVDESKRSRPIIGSPVLIDMAPDGPARWKGAIYNAEDGKTYTAYLTPVSADEIKVEGCAMGGLVCKTQRWTKVR